MTQILLVGSDESLLEGLVQTLAAVGHSPRIAHSIADARDIATTPPMVAVVEHGLVAEAGTLGIPLAAGGVYVLYHGAGDFQLTLPHALRRQVLAVLSLPLERNRLVALVQVVEERARAAGRGRDTEPPEALHGR